MSGVRAAYADAHEFSSSMSLLFRSCDLPGNKRRVVFVVFSGDGIYIRPSQSGK